MKATDVIRQATIADIPRIIDLLHQVDMVHHRLRPDLFKPHTGCVVRHRRSIARTSMATSSNGL